LDEEAKRAKSNKKGKKRAFLGGIHQLTFLPFLLLFALFASSFKALLAEQLQININKEEDWEPA
jgi:hypothetical protein